MKACIGMVGAALVGLLTLPALGKAKSIAAQWEFDRDGDYEGWTLGGQIVDAAVAGGTFRGRTVGTDPITFGPLVELKAAPTQRIEIRMKTTGKTDAQLFWTETLEGKFGGFSQEKLNAFPAQPDGQFHVYRIYPFWHAVGKIIRLRFDPPSDGEFAIDWIRVIDGPAVEPSSAASWQFKAGAQAWQPLQEISEPTVRNGLLEAASQGGSPILLSPPLAVPGERAIYASVRMAVDGGKSGRVYCATRRRIGWEPTGFPLRADGKMHTYNIELPPLESPDDQVLVLGLTPTDLRGAGARIESIEIGEHPGGPPELEITFFGSTEGVCRAGRPTEVLCVLRNLGGSAAQGVTATLGVPKGVQVLGAAAQKLDPVPHAFRKTVSWSIEAAEPGSAELTVRLDGIGEEPICARQSIALTRPPEVPQSGYIPTPQPVRSELEVGAFYFPGWDSMSRWEPILSFPERKPVLGWYDEANPECADWQIKWAAEHGIDFFLVDWYWCRGSRHLEHWLHSAYQKTRYRNHLKWAVMWANHNPPNTHSKDDWREVTRFWIDRYFGMPEYYRIDDRPAVFIWAPGNVRNDLGGSEKAAELYALSQQMARDAGYKGIYFVAMSSHESDSGCRQLKSEGYEAFTSYHSFQLAHRRAGSDRFPYADVVETSPEVWREADRRASGLAYFPLVDTGWAAEPWHGDKTITIFDRTPELFGRACREAADYAKTAGKRIMILGPWNEWGEGSYIEPCAEFGFRHLDALRDAVCDSGNFPPNLVPKDVGRGPYDLPPIEYRTAWQFDTQGDSEGWIVNGDLKIQVRDGALEGETTGHDPTLSTQVVRVEASQLRRLSIRMKSSAAATAQFFWATKRSRATEATSVSFKVPGDGEFHDYTLDLGKNAAWRGQVTYLRFDPAGASGVRFAVDSIRLE
ncbi:MAG: glycoside hydrolase family 99-like domain-containing protein [Pirellulales bacterium]|nr:glycoside hydrolase family 99-like domain-containing protein [Pirellulales bacterium]